MIKRTIKIFYVAHNFEIVRAVIQKAPDGVIFDISNTALNARQGAVAISPHLRPLFRRHYHHFGFILFTIDSQFF